MVSSSRRASQEIAREPRHHKPFSPSCRFHQSQWLFSSRHQVFGAGCSRCISPLAHLDEMVWRVVDTIFGAQIAHLSPVPVAGCRAHHFAGPIHASIDRRCAVVSYRHWWLSTARLGCPARNLCRPSTTGGMWRFHLAVFQTARIRIRRGRMPCRASRLARGTQHVDPKQ